jgi:hypothetical protein
VAIPLAIQTNEATFTSWKLQDEFDLFQGEWQFDTTQGFPWVPGVLGLKNPSLSQIRALLRQAILSTPLIVSVTDLALTLNRKTRALGYVFSADLAQGATVTGGTGAPFVVTPGAPAQSSGVQYNLGIGPPVSSGCSTANPCGGGVPEVGPPGPPGPSGPAGAPGTGGGLSPLYIAGPQTFTANAGYLYVIDLTLGAVVMNVAALALASASNSGTGFILVHQAPTSLLTLTVNPPAGVQFAPPPPNNTTTVSSLVFNTAEDAGASLDIDNFGTSGVYATS